MERALKSLKLSLHSNEDWLLGALLGTNHDGNLFRNQSSQDTWRGKDYLYAFHD